MFQGIINKTITIQHFFNPLTKKLRFIFLYMYLGSLLYCKWLRYDCFVFDQVMILFFNNNKSDRAYFIFSDTCMLYNIINM